MSVPGQVKIDQVDGIRFLRVCDWHLPFDTLASRVRLDLCPDCEDDLRRLCAAAEAVARPGAAWRTVDSVAALDGERVVIAGLEFRSAMLAHNLASAQRVWPYLASCGPALDELVNQPDLSGVFEDCLAEYWLDCIKALALDAAFEALRLDVLDRADPGRLSAMNPGSGDVTLWSIEQQRPLFKLLGNAIQEWVGVKLGDSCLMHPNKSVSGLFFHGAEDFDSCAYCEREHCPGRRVPWQGGGLQH
jgi:hypothetical protein